MGGKSFVVVGAGLPGIAASLTLAKRGRSVVLIDTAPEIGGLLRSYQVDDFEFDFGTHFANRTGVDELDEMLFGGYETDWVEYPVLRAGNYWNGVLNEGSDNPDLNSAGRESHDRCLADMLAAPGWGEEREPASGREFLESEYGPDLVERFFDPVLRKFTGNPSDALHRDAHLLFNLKRFGVLDPSATTELKRSPRFDGKVAFHHRNQFSGHRPCLYPREGGIGRWISQLENKLRDAGVRVVKGARIEHIATGGGEVIALEAAGATIPVESLIWAVAPASFCLAAGIELVGERPRSRATVLAGVEFDRPFLSDLHYLTVFDPNFASFRITLYPNFRSASADRPVATVEFMVDPAESASRDWETLAVDEIKRMGLLADGGEVLRSHEKTIPVGFPVPTGASVEGLAGQVGRVREFANVRLIGRTSGSGWFLDGLLCQAYRVAIELIH